MHRVGHLHGRRPPGPGTGRLTILQTQALYSACGRAHVSAGSSGLPGPGGLNLTLGRFLRLASPVAWPGSPAVWGLLMDPVGLWGPPTWKPGPLAPWRTLLAGETYMPPDRPTHLRRAPTPKSRSRTDRPTNALNSALRGASLGTATSGLYSPRNKPNPRWCVQDLDPRGLAQNSPNTGRPQAEGRTRPLSQEQTLSLCAVYDPRGERKQHASWRPCPLSWPLRAPNAGSEEPPESRPQLRPWVRP